MISFLGSSFLLNDMRQIVFSPDTAGLDSRTILQSPGSDEDNVVLLFMKIFLVMCIVY